MTYESICEELDSLALSYLNILNEYTYEWKNTSNEFQQVNIVTTKSMITEFSFILSLQH